MLPSLVLCCWTVVHTVVIHLWLLGKHTNLHSASGAGAALNLLNPPPVNLCLGSLPGTSTWRGPMLCLSAVGCPCPAPHWLLQNKGSTPNCHLFQALCTCLQLAWSLFSWHASCIIFVSLEPWTGACSGLWEGWAGSPCWSLLFSPVVWGRAFGLATHFGLPLPTLHSLLTYAPFCNSCQTEQIWLILLWVLRKGNIDSLGLLFLLFFCCTQTQQVARRCGALYDHSVESR